ncbi:g8142 [Coccomyxa viridis]|uniref:G8142 protein n=1 Tax=Coccomyxa viridis TaxID=1274662 RepID=A0ABP1FZN3_9CHLO
MECCHWKNVAFHLTTNVTPWIGLTGACIGLVILSLNNFGPKPCKPENVYVPIPCPPCEQCDHTPVYTEQAPAMAPAKAHYSIPRARHEWSAVMPSGAPGATDGRHVVPENSTKFRFNRVNSTRSLGKPK